MLFGHYGNYCSFGNASLELKMKLFFVVVVVPNNDFNAQVNRFKYVPIMYVASLM